MTRRAIHALVSALLAPSGVRVRDHVAFLVWRHVRPLRALRAWWRDRGGRPGWRWTDYR